jgi:hypothetical protein
VVDGGLGARDVEGERPVVEFGHFIDENTAAGVGIRRRQ